MLQWIENFLCNRKQCVINGVSSEWFKVRSGIPQGSILGPILFLIYINDFPDYCNESSTNCNMFLYADDAKLCRYIASQEDNLFLQRAIDRFKNWSDTWLLELNISKCKVVSYSMKDRTDTSYSISDNGETYALDKKDKIKDLGVTFDSRLTFHDHIQEKVNRAYSMLGLIKRNFIYMDSNTFILLYMR